jgi:glycosyltransferase involved in cell wall biosynthesis
LVDCFQMLPERIRVVYNAVNPARFTPLETEQQSKLRNELGIPSGQPVVVCASNLRPEKGIDHLMQAASRVLAKRPDTYFVIVGGGPLAPQLQELAVKLGIAANVRFTGLRSDVHRYMAMANVVAVPSVWQEPAGFVVIEAIACGRPVVATRVGGIPEYMADGVTGIAVDPAAPEQLANALLRLLNSPEEAAAMGRAGRTRVEDRLSIDRWVRETISLYEEALRARRSK